MNEFDISHDEVFIMILFTKLIVYTLSMYSFFCQKIVLFFSHATLTNISLKISDLEKTFFKLESDVLRSAI